MRDRTRRALAAGMHPDEWPEAGDAPPDVETVRCHEAPAYPDVETPGPVWPGRSEPMDEWREEVARDPRAVVIRCPGCRREYGAISRGWTYLWDPDTGEHSKIRPGPDAEETMTCSCGTTWDPRRA